MQVTCLDLLKVGRVVVQCDVVASLACSADTELESVRYSSVPVSSHTGVSISVRTDPGLQETR